MEQITSSLCDYSDVYILVKGTITDENSVMADADANNINKENCATFLGWLSETDNAQIGNAKDSDVVMPVYNLIKYSNDYSKICKSFYDSIVQMNLLRSYW